MDNDQAEMNQYYGLLGSSQFEGKRLRFYRDNVGLVTIGVGELVDERGLPAAQGEAICQRWLQSRPFVSFQRANGTSCSQAEILADWRAVKGGAQAALRISEAVCRQIFFFKITQFVNQMAGARSYADQLPVLVQRALVDVRFNPGGLNPFDDGEPAMPNAGAKRRLWRHLELATGASAAGLGEAGTRIEHLLNALQGFRDGWAQRGPDRLRRRHVVHRCGWFATGIRESMSPQERADPINRMLEIPGAADPLAAL